MHAGKMLGGSSSIGDHQYTRGNRKNYDDWAALGATGWSFKDVFPYFLKLEDNTDKEYLLNGNFDRFYLFIILINYTFNYIRFIFNIQNKINTATHCFSSSKELFSKEEIGYYQDKLRPNFEISDMEWSRT